jgi:subtilisin family serine protease
MKNHSVKRKVSAPSFAKKTWNTNSPNNKNRIFLKSDNYSFSSHKRQEIRTWSFFLGAIVFLFSSLSINSYAARVIVQLSKPITAVELAQLNTQARIIRHLHPLDWLVLEIPNTRRVLRTSKEGDTKEWPYQLDRQGYFASNPTTLPIPNDPRYTEQWHLTQIGIFNLWKMTQGEGSIIALLDTGVDPDHPDLSANILFDQGYDFGDEDEKPYDENGHGTAMAGLMVAQCYNDEGGCGVAPAAKVIPYKINQQNQDGFFESNLAAAILAAADSQAKIISLSLALTNYSQIVQDALDFAKTKDKIVVAAAGHKGNAVAYPASESWVIGVGAFDKEGQRLPSSNYGDGLSVSAPGIDLLTTLLGTGYADWYDGTSGAAALVSGVLALMTALEPNATAPQLTVTLLASCQDIDPPGFDSQQGFGHLNVPTEPISDNLKNQIFHGFLKMYQSFIPVTH